MCFFTYSDRPAGSANAVIGISPAADTRSCSSHSRRLRQVGSNLIGSVLPLSANQVLQQADCRGSQAFGRLQAASGSIDGPLLEAEPQSDGCFAGRLTTHLS